MATIQEISTQSLLAQAAYADLQIGTISKTDLTGKPGMADSQAADFASKWTVVDQYKDASGVSATVFQEIASGKKYLAIRGTEGLGADAVFSQASATLYNQWNDDKALSADDVAQDKANFSDAYS